MKKIAKAIAAVASALCLSGNASYDFGHLVERHTRELFRQGYALEIEDEDFCHGHMLLPKNSKMNYQTMDEFLKSTAIIVYHTDEISATQRNHEPKDHRKGSRSLAGLLDGRILPLEYMVDMTKLTAPEDYKEHKTIHASELAHQSGYRYPELTSNSPEIKSIGCMNQQFLIRKNPNGCFEAAGRRFDIVFNYREDCNGFLSDLRLPCE